MQAGAGLALAVVGAQSVHTAVLAAPVVHLALINICKKKKKKKSREKKRHTHINKHMSIILKTVIFSVTL